MTVASSAPREAFGSRAGFILAAAGSAVGLGNMWRFPYQASEGGGAAFVMVYIGLTLVLGIPLMLAEFGIGRRGQLSPIGSLRKLAGPSWVPLGYLFVAVGLLILSYYSVIAGWTLRYGLEAVFLGFPADSAATLRRGRLRWRRRRLPCGVHGAHGCDRDRRCEGRHRARLAAADAAAVPDGGGAGPVGRHAAGGRPGLPRVPEARDRRIAESERVARGGVTGCSSPSASAWAACSRSPPTCVVTRTCPSPPRWSRSPISAWLSWPACWCSR